VSRLDYVGISIGWTMRDYIEQQFGVVYHSLANIDTYIPNDHF
jgi:hypothetical protein